MAAAPAVGDHRVRLEAEGSVAIILDPRDLTFLDCSGLRALLAARDRSKANGRRFIMVGAGLVARRVFELTRTQFLLDEQEAVSLLDQFTRTSAERVVRTAVPDRGVHV